jgi:hypothetical protein
MTFFLPDRMSASDPAPIIPGLAHRTADSEPELRRIAKSLLSCRTGFALGKVPHMTPQFDLRVKHKTVQQQAVERLRGANMAGIIHPGDHLVGRFCANR